MLRYDVSRDRAQVKALTAGDDRRENLLRVSRREDEFNVRRRLFEGFEKGVEGRIGEHVHLINVDDLERAAGGGILHRVAEFAHLFDAVVRRSIDFENIQRAAFGDFLSEFVIRIEVYFRAVFGVQSLRKDASHGCFTRASGAYEKISVREAVLLDRVTQCLYDMVLAEDVVKGLRTVFAGEDLVAHRFFYLFLRAWMKLLM